MSLIENKNFNEINTQYKEINDTDELTKAQWLLIHDLENKYKGKIVRGTNCLFEEDRWHEGDGYSDDGVIIWENHFNPDQEAIKILVKCIYFEWIRGRGNTIGTTSGKLCFFKKYIHIMFVSKKLLIGSSNDFLMGLNYITDEDIQITLDIILFNSTSELQYVSSCNELENFFNYVNSFSNDIPLFSFNAKFPWYKAGCSVSSWASRRAIDLDIMFKVPKGYEPLLPETVFAIIERSMNIVENYQEAVIDIQKILLELDGVKNNSAKKLKGIVKTYSPIFDSLYPSSEIVCGEKSKLNTTVKRWLREIIYLARGACINIIALTTGLRNVDIRNMKVDCCKPSGRVDMLYYISVSIRKTKNSIHIPVPEQANIAVKFLTKIKSTNSPYLLDSEIYPAFNKANKDQKEARLLSGDSINKYIRQFAEYFNIKFINENKSTEYSIHCYRTTVAGWISASSNLSVLMVRRLFGHSNDLMPMVYLRNNPAFIEERREAKVISATETARQMALAASEGRLSGNKGVQLERGYKLHHEKCRNKSYSLTDVDVLYDFSEMLKNRILNETVCGFLTPFGIRCMRNPNDTRQPPCAKRAHKNITKDIDKKLLDLFSDIDPQQCIGTSCSEAMVGPWSESIKESLVWYVGLLNHQHGEKFTDENFREHAIQFIRQYSPSIEKVFGIKISWNEIISTEVV